MKKFLPLFACLPFAALAQNQAPQVQLGQLSRSTTDTTQISLPYLLTDAEQDACEVWLRYSTDGGRSFRALPGASGDVGFPVQPGNRTVVFNTANFQGVGAQAVIIRLVASDRQPVSIASMVARVDTQRLRQQVQQFAMARHYQQNQANMAAIRDTIEQRFQQAQLATFKQAFVANNVPVANMIGRKSGHRNDSALWIVDAHFDAVVNTPGADDNASGLVGMLECARILSDYEFEESLQFMGFDVEEIGLIGSTRYVSQGRSLGDLIKGVFNFEMIGYYSDAPNTQQLPAGFNLLFPAVHAQITADSFRGNFLANVGNVTSLPLTALFDTAAAMYVPLLKVRSVNLPGNGTIAPDFRRSDHAPFWDAGFQALMLTDGADFRNNRYHTPADSAATLNYTFMGQIVQATLAAAATAAKPMQAGKADLTYGFPLWVDDGHKPHADCELRILPNPSAGQLILLIDACKGPYGPAKLRIFGLDGREYYATTLPHATSHRLDLQLDLPDGNYLVVTDDGHESFTARLLVRR